MISTPNSHPCAVPGCKWSISLQSMMCVDHYNQVPRELRDEILRANVRGDAEAYLALKVKAVAHVRQAKAAQTAANQPTAVQSDLL